MVYSVYTEQTFTIIRAAKPDVQLYESTNLAGLIWEKLSRSIVINSSSGTEEYAGSRPLEVGVNYDSGWVDSNKKIGLKIESKFSNPRQTVNAVLAMLIASNWRILLVLDNLVLSGDIPSVQDKY
ncbi:MAG: hypothetical protein WBB28_02110 [Crinalium sp.]